MLLSFITGGIGGGAQRDPADKLPVMVDSFHNTGDVMPANLPVTVAGLQ